jgi:hypothetical protein
MQWQLRYARLHFGHDTAQVIDEVLKVLHVRARTGSRAMTTLIERETGNAALDKISRDGSIAIRVLGQAVNDEQRGSRLRSERGETGQAPGESEFGDGHARKDRTTSRETGDGQSKSRE